MLAKEMFQFSDLLTQQGIIFCYNGYITENLLSVLGKTLKEKMALENIDDKIALRVFALFVEQVQNIIRYSDEKVLSLSEPDNQNIDMRFGLLVVGHKNDKHFVACANMVNNKDVDRLRTTLNKVQHMGRKELMALQKKILREGTPEGSKGAGVGFIDIARRATQGFEFHFVEKDNNRTYFSIKSYI